MHVGDLLREDTVLCPSSQWPQILLGCVVNREAILRAPCSEHTPLNVYPGSEKTHLVWSTGILNLAQASSRAQETGSTAKRLDGELKPVMEEPQDAQQRYRSAVLPALSPSYRWVWSYAALMSPQAPLVGTIHDMA